MSSSSTLVTEEHFAYLAARTVREDALLRNLRKAAEKEGLPTIHIAPEQGSFMQLLLTIAKAKKVVEVGTLGGYSAIWMARSGAKVLTIEINPKHAEFARSWVAKSDVADRVEVRLGSGQEVLPTLKDASCDAAFLDADKAGYPGYLKECLRIVKPGGMILADNAFAFGELFSDRPRDQEVEAVKRFNEILAKTPGLHGIIVPIGDGLWISVRRA